MTLDDLVSLLPILITAAAAVVVMLAIAVRRHHGATLFLTLAGLAAAFLALPGAWHGAPRQVTELLIVDRYALVYIGLILAAGMAVAGLSYGYLRCRSTRVEEFYLLLLTATLGAAVLAASCHYASFFLGLETLSVSLYGLIAYPRFRAQSIEAGLKYLILAGVSSAFLVFGMALIYADLGSLTFARSAELLRGIVQGPSPMLAACGLGTLVIGIGFKLAVVPFHQWTPDVYEGAPAPVAAFVATVSKGAMVALLLRLFLPAGFGPSNALFRVFLLLAVASMIAGNLLALLQPDVKRLLAYSSIAHMGYVLVAFLAGGEGAVTAVTFYMAAYFATTLGAFGVVTVLSGREGDAGDLETYRGLAWTRPWLAFTFTVMLLSLAGIPLTAGFLGKFTLVAAGVNRALWLPVMVLVLTSGVGLYYYLRVVVVLFDRPADGKRAAVAAPSLTRIPGLSLALLTGLVVWLGVDPAPFLKILQDLGGVSW